MTVHSAPGCPSAIQPTKTIAFAPGYDEDKAKQIIWFMALVDGNWVFCSIPYQSLRNCFGGAIGDEVEAVFVANRQAIEKAAQTLIRLGFVRGDQQVWLSEAAVMHLRTFPFPDD